MTLLSTEHTVHIQPKTSLYLGFQKGFCSSISKMLQTIFVIIKDVFQEKIEQAQSKKVKHTCWDESRIINFKNRGTNDFETSIERERNKARSNNLEFKEKKVIEEITPIPSFPSHKSQIKISILQQSSHEQWLSILRLWTLQHISFYELCCNQESYP